MATPLVHCIIPGVKRLFRSAESKCHFAKFVHLEKNPLAQLVLQTTAQELQSSRPEYSQFVEELVLLGSNLAVWAVKESLDYHPAENDIDFGIILKPAAITTDIDKLESFLFEIADVAEKHANALGQKICETIHSGHVIWILGQGPAPFLKNQSQKLNSLAQSNTVELRDLMLGLSACLPLLSESEDTFLDLCRYIQNVPDFQRTAVITWLKEALRKRFAVLTKHLPLEVVELTGSLDDIILRKEKLAKRLNLLQAQNLNRKIEAIFAKLPIS